MVAAIDGFLQQLVLAAQTGLAVGYEFLEDQAQAVADEMQTRRPGY